MVSSSLPVRYNSIISGRRASPRAGDVTLTDADLAQIKEILPTGGFGARYAQDLPEWI